MLWNLYQRSIRREIEGGQAGASGPGAPAPAPAAAPAAPAPGVRGSAAPADGDGPFPRIFRGAQPAPAAGGGADDDDLEAAITADTEGRGIPHDRVRAMWAGREKKLREQLQRETREGLMQDLAPMLEELHQLRGVAANLDPKKQRLDLATSILKALGVEEEPAKPDFLTRQDHEKSIEELRAQFTREAQHRSDMDRARAELAQARVKHEKWFKHFPMLEELAAVIWSQKSVVAAGTPFGSVVDALVGRLDEGLGAYNKAYADEKLKDGEQNQPIVPGSGPTPGKKPPAKVDHSPEGTAKRAIEELERLQRAG